MSRQSDTIKTQKTWFDNAELSSGKHDEILVWLHAQIKGNGLLKRLLNTKAYELGNGPHEHASLLRENDIGFIAYEP